MPLPAPLAAVMLKEKIQDIERKVEEDKTRQDYLNDNTKLMKTTESTIFEKYECETKQRKEMETRLLDYLESKTIQLHNELLAQSNDRAVSIITCKQNYKTIFPSYKKQLKSKRQKEQTLLRASMPK